MQKVFFKSVKTSTNLAPKNIPFNVFKFPQYPTNENDFPPYSFVDGTIIKIQITNISDNIFSFYNEINPDLKNINVDYYAKNKFAVQDYLINYYVVDWGDGTHSLYDITDFNSIPSHIYSNTGTYTIKITNTISSGLCFKNSEKVTDLIQLGNRLTNIDNMFENCVNLSSNMINFHSGLISTRYAFARTNIGGTIPPLVESLQDVEGTFEYCKKLTTIISEDEDVIMPESISSHSNFVYGCDDDMIRIYYYPDWGGLKAFGVNVNIENDNQLFEFSKSPKLKDSAEYVRIYWGDKTSTQYSKEMLSENVPSHTYENSGTYNILFSESLSSAEGMLSGNENVIGLLSWGRTLVDTSLCFKNCKNMISGNLSWPDTMLCAIETFNGCVRLSSSIKPWPSETKEVHHCYSECYNINGNIPEWPSAVTNANHTYFHAWTLTGNIPEWKDTSISNALQCYCHLLNLTGNVPEWPDTMLCSKGCYWGCNKITGNIPEWPENIIDVSRTYQECSNLSGVWSENATFYERMPKNIKTKYYCVYNAGSKLRSLFTSEWGGTMKLEDISEILIQTKNKKYTFTFNEAPTLIDGIESYCIDWGDGIILEYKANEIPSHTYSNIDSITEYVIQIENKLKSIENAFSSNQSIISLNKLGSNLINISKAFFNNNYLSSFCELPSATQYAISAFANCQNLSGSIINIPENLIDGSYMFNYCTSLTESIPELNDELLVTEGMFSMCSGLTGDIPTLPAKLINGNNMFDGAYNLSGNVPDLPDTLQQSVRMFAELSDLTGNIPLLPKSIINCQSMYYDCSNLTGTVGSNDNENMPDSVETSNHQMYVYGCGDNLRSLYYEDWGGTRVRDFENGTIVQINIPETNLTQSFYKWPSRTVYFKDGSSNYCVNWGDGTIERITTTGRLPSHTYTEAGTYQIKVSDDFKAIGSLFRGNQFITDVIQYGDSVISAAYTFRNCDGLTSLCEFGDNMTYIEGIYSLCDGITKPADSWNNVVNAKYAYTTCTNLTSVPKWSDKLEDVKGCFNGCKKISEIWNEDATDEELMPNTQITEHSSCFSNASNYVRKFFYPDWGGTKIDLTSGTIFTISLTSDNQTFKFNNAPQINSDQSQFRINWGDGSDIETFENSETIPEHEYDVGGEYVIQIENTISSLANVFENNSCIINVLKYGSILTDATNTFKNIQTLTSICDWGENLSNVNDTYSMCNNITGSIPNWNNNIVYANGTFYNCSNLTGSIPNWNEKTEQINLIYFGCNKLSGNIPDWNDTLQNANQAYQYCENITGNIPKWGESLVNVSDIYFGCKKITGTWNDSTNDSELMPDSIINHSGAVSNTTESLQQLFYESWGGTKTIKSDDTQNVDQNPDDSTETPDSGNDNTDSGNNDGSSTEDSSDTSDTDDLFENGTELTYIISNNSYSKFINLTGKIKDE